MPATARNLHLFGELIATETAHDNSAKGINSERKRRKGSSLSNTRLEASSLADSGPEAPGKCSKCAQMLAPLRFSNVTCQCKGCETGIPALRRIATKVGPGIDVLLEEVEARKPKDHAKHLINLEEKTSNPIEKLPKIPKSSGKGGHKLNHEPYNLYEAKKRLFSIGGHRIEGRAKMMWEGEHYVGENSSGYISNRSRN